MIKQLERQTAEEVTVKHGFVSVLLLLRFTALYLAEQIQLELPAPCDQPASEAASRRHKAQVERSLSL